MSSTPQELGFRMPAEREAQDAVWLSWPLNEETWPGLLPWVQERFAGIASAISKHERVRINCRKQDQMTACRLIRNAGADMERVELFDIPTDDAWCRDHGPTFIRNDETGEMAVVDWHYNAWGGKFPPWEQDNAVAGKVARALDLKRFGAPLVCEGGAIEVNGEGVVLTTESVLLNHNRNPEMGKKEVAAILKQYLGVERVFWLKVGLAGDDTDGHIDTLVRFFRKDAVLTVVEEDSKSINYWAMMENRERLEELRTLDGSGCEIVDLPLPAPVHAKDNREAHLPASYANFLIINEAVLLPTFRQPENDERAAGILRECFPGRKVIPVDSVDLLQEGGAVHCITQQQPRK